MTPEQFNVLHERFAYWFKNHEDAVRLCSDLLLVAHVWDDVLDSDNGDQKYKVDAVLCTLLFDVSTNKFFIDNQTSLVPVLKLVYRNWHTANSFEKEHKDLHKAYMLRASLYNLFSTCAALIGGDAWGACVDQDVWATYGEVYEVYEKEILNA